MKSDDSMRKVNGSKCLTKAAVLFLTVAVVNAACSFRDIRPKYDPSIEPFGYESVAYEDNGFKVVSPTSVDTIYNDFTTDTVLVVTPISDLKDRKQIGSDVSPTWHAIEAPCKVLAVIKNETGHNDAPLLEVGDTVNLVERMFFYRGEDEKVVLVRHDYYSFPMQKGQPYLWFGAYSQNETKGVGRNYWPVYAAFDISEREVTEYEDKAMTAPETAVNKYLYIETLGHFANMKREASASVVFSPYFDAFSNVD